MIKFYMDEHVAYAITKALKRKGIDVLTIQEDNSMSISDQTLLDRATQLGRVVFTHDDDFLRESVARQEQQTHFCGIVYGHQKRVSTGKCIEDLELIASIQP
ncbi:DUF5615 family PIN-like protein [Candidatus Uabimicrobium amorphum]|uniref:DUF5615 domain-containing protein n=1 Tax=Uabimicrobium amorphum TaxID=2596890 RepID=A0A5S9F6E2_UABAM|nr:DUF5615 family PIN-like protein [Candidatus Uabimicrobium amorphum]BBM87602.1 hypothetical protein UABAM_06014 [Candidatus Uabimicrobium amorphum]